MKKHKEKKKSYNMKTYNMSYEKNTKRKKKRLNTE